MKVVFLKDDEGDIFAYFPFEEWCNGTMTCHAHIGQHSACSPKYAEESRDATLLEYLDLFNELQSIGYKLELI